MEFVALTHPHCFLFLLPIGYLSRILHRSLIVARTHPLPPPHILEPRLASVPLMVATASASSLIAATSSLLLLLPLPCHHQQSLSPLPLSLGLVVPLSAASSCQPQNSHVVVQQTIAPARLCLFWWLIVVFFMLFFNHTIAGGMALFSLPLPLLCFSHTHRSWYWPTMHGACHHQSQHCNHWDGRGGLSG